MAAHVPPFLRYFSGFQTFSNRLARLGFSAKAANTANDVTTYLGGKTTGGAHVLRELCLSQSPFIIVF
ncbi:hypothetical protein [Roseibium sp. RKSG952]|uniref:hypothetical protein n=1 Tax=Roseibium sp. RKSG952 TaxID=2529384 RepID=UPI0012BD2D2A|nr:hypothetical protein [Roseibium sp. RKSG952]MTH95849.1 hypothetical protein [Roseibium sp. RKSG952]